MSKQERRPRTTSKAGNWKIEPAHVTTTKAPLVSPGQQETSRPRKMLSVEESPRMFRLLKSFIQKFIAGPVAGLALPHFDFCNHGNGDPDEGGSAAGNLALPTKQREKLPQFLVLIKQFLVFKQTSSKVIENCDKKNPRRSGSLFSEANEASTEQN